jgi:outer membrane protein OmpA-like peptidoglycan-associated protein
MPTHPRHHARLLYALLLALPLATHAQTDQIHARPAIIQGASVQSAPAIVEALTAKRVVLDQPNHSHQTVSAIDLQVQFIFDSAQLLPQGKRQLDQLALALNDRQLQLSGFQLAGHTDQQGDADYNLKLSLARAQAVKTYLVAVHGIAQERMQTVGFGFAHLRNPEQPYAAINRRVEVRRLDMQAVVK